MAERILHSPLPLCGLCSWGLKALTLPLTFFFGLPLLRGISLRSMEQLPFLLHRPQCRHLKQFDFYLFNMTDFSPCSPHLALQSRDRNDGDSVYHVLKRVSSVGGQTKPLLSPEQTEPNTVGVLTPPAKSRYPDGCRKGRTGVEESRNTLKESTAQPRPIPKSSDGDPLRGSP